MTKAEIVAALQTQLLRRAFLDPETVAAMLAVIERFSQPKKT